MISILSSFPGFLNLHHSHVIVINYVINILSIIEIKDSAFLRDLFGDDNADLNVLQMMVRAFVTFLIALALIRVAGIRSFGSKSAFDIVLSITVGAVLSRCITGHYSFLACISAAAVLA